MKKKRKQSCGLTEIWTRVLWIRRPTSEPLHQRYIDELKAKNIVVWWNKLLFKISVLRAGRSELLKKIWNSQFFNNFLQLFLLHLCRNILFKKKNPYISVKYISWLKKKLQISNHFYQLVLWSKSQICWTVFIFQRSELQYIKKMVKN